MHGFWVTPQPGDRTPIRDRLPGELVRDVQGLGIGQARPLLTDFSLATFPQGTNASQSYALSNGIRWTQALRGERLMEVTDTAVSRLRAGATPAHQQKLTDEPIRVAEALEAAGVFRRIRVEGDAFNVAAEMLQGGFVVTAHNYDALTIVPNLPHLTSRHPEGLILAGSPDLLANDRRDLTRDAPPYLLLDTYSGNLRTIGAEEFCKRITEADQALVCIPSASLPAQLPS